MSTLLRLAHQLLIALLGITVLVLMVPVSMQIGSRFFEWIPNYMWTEEMSRFFFIWMVMIGATVGVREGLHFDVDIWANPSPALARFLTLGQPPPDSGLCRRGAVLGHRVHEVWLEPNI